MSNGLQLDSGFGRTDEMDTLNNSMSTVIKCHLHTLHSYAVKFFEVVLCSLTHPINQPLNHSLTKSGVHFNCMLQCLLSRSVCFSMHLLFTIRCNPQFERSNFTS
ncbi:hypothetical protein CRM22_004202 [Opisthorchis felineus]|uniref:Uncharacterized protein n=1 Tax=Opisthorchis felineus TaxID=147828 RepID=A0A4S2LXD8_OPIFE|nr:hypothetical protein CRM22_004202 [Opisthorchis felineus]